MITIGLDCSTTSATAVAWDRAGDALATGRACLETASPSPGFAELLDNVAGAAGVSCDTVAVGGGGSRADVWCGILADAFGVPVRRPRSVELSSLGASWCARRAVAIEDEPPLSSCWNPSSGDEFTPDRDRVALYAGLREIHRTLYAATARASHALAEAGV